MTEPNVDPTGQLQDLRHSKPMPIKKTLVIVNNYIVNTTRFLNRFSEIVDEKLIKVSTSLARLETTLSVLESKLGSVPGLDATEPPPIPEPVTTTTTTASNEIIQAGTGTAILLVASYRYVHARVSVGG